MTVRFTTDQGGARRTRPEALPTEGLPAFLRLLLEAAYAEARCFACSHLLLELDGQGGLSLVEAGHAVPARALVEALARGGPWPGEASTLRQAAWEALGSVRGAVRVDAWEDGRQWRALRTPDGRAWEVEALQPCEPCPAPGGRGARLGCLPEGGTRGVDAEALRAHARALAFLAPGLEVRCTESGGRERCALWYPRGLAQRVEELTGSLPRLHREPFAFDVRWDGLRARCALQWCDVDGGLLLAYANTRRTSRHAPHVTACLHTVRAALAALAGVPPTALPAFRLLRGLTAVVAVDGPPERVPASDAALSPAAAREAEVRICEALYPLALQAFGAHPLTPRLLSRALAPA